MLKSCKHASALFVILGVMLSPALAETADIKGASDHPLVGRYDGARINFQETKEYDEISLPVKVLERGKKDDASTWLGDFSGKITSLGYEGPDNRSALEVMRNFEAALTDKGFKIRFSCFKASDCAPGGAGAFWDKARGKVGMLPVWDTTTYILAERDQPEGKVTVAILGIEIQPTQSKPLRPHLAVTVVEAKPMEKDKIRVLAADQLQQSLDADGKVAIYGIYFDFDKAELKPESLPQLNELASLLSGRPELNVLVVGHTDGEGTFDYNLALSQRRAQAVVDHLVKNHGLARSRLVAAGAGMMAPVASNRTEEGRARNRRVEIVERLGK
ncbi:OmpA family protein [Daeguia caeni]|uniref:OmpA family protein n=1 Tax=Daeguia caeni TaxID=439612 RepID=A0ABV9H6I0_9HYPH